jgi:hypothetical protein
MSAQQSAGNFTVFFIEPSYKLPNHPLPSFTMMISESLFRSPALAGLTMSAAMVVFTSWHPPAPTGLI